MWDIAADQISLRFGQSVLAGFDEGAVENGLCGVVELLACSADIAECVLGFKVNSSAETVPDNKIFEDLLD